MASTGYEGGHGVVGDEPGRLSLDRALKRFCPDFAPIRQVLRTIDARLVSRTEQTDYFFFLPGSSVREDSRRLKLRLEDRRPVCVYYYDRENHSPRGSGTGRVSFQKFEVGDPVIREVLEAALSVRKIVRKHRELWRKGPAIFNLDRVEGVGQVFELEIEPDGSERDALLAADYLELFDPYLGTDITGSNEDLVPDTL